MDQADFHHREMYNIQISINNNLVLLNRNVERWMRRGEADEAERVERGVGTEQKIERKGMQRESEEMMDGDVSME